MQNYSKNLVCDYKQYTFPYALYHCNRHGIFVWTGKKHEIFDMRKRINHVCSVEHLDPTISERFEYMPTLDDYVPVKMKCPICIGEWKQHIGFLIGNKETVFCPFCGAEISTK